MSTHIHTHIYIDRGRSEDGFSLQAKNWQKETIKPDQLNRESHKIVRFTTHLPKYHTTYLGHLPLDVYHVHAQLAESPATYIFSIKKKHDTVYIFGQGRKSHAY